MSPRTKFWLPILFQSDVPPLLSVFLGHVCVVVVLLQPLQEVTLIRHGGLRHKTDDGTRLNSTGQDNGTVYAVCEILCVCLLICHPTDHQVSCRYSLSCTGVPHRSWPSIGQPPCRGWPPRLCPQPWALKQLRGGQNGEDKNNNFPQNVRCWITAGWNPCRMNIRASWLSLLRYLTKSPHWCDGIKPLPRGINSFN